MGVSIELEHREAVQLSIARVVILIVIDLTLVADDPLAVEHPEGLGLAGANDVLQPVGALIGRGQHAFFHAEQERAAGKRKGHHRQRRSIQADAARAHHDQLAVLGQQSNRDQRRQQHGEGRDVGQVFRGRPEEELSDHVMLTKPASVLRATGLRRSYGQSEVTRP